MEKNQERFAKVFGERIVISDGPMLRGLDDYMIWMNKVFRTGIAHGTL
jgi:hypothetical protein